MLAELRFVMGAVSKKDIVQSMQHFVIKDGMIRAYNGRVALGAPINFDIDCQPHAVDLVKAISLCSEQGVVTISMTPAGKLKVQNNDARWFVECVTDDVPHPLPEGDVLPISGKEIREAFSVLERFIGTDASRPWTNGILLHDKSAYATNNITICQYWLGTPVPFTVNIPGEAIKEILRVKDDPTHIQLTDNSITFHYEGGKWIRSGLWDASAISQVASVMDSVVGNPVVTNPELFKALASVGPFVGKLKEIYFIDGEVATDYEDNIGARFKLEGLPEKACFLLTQLQDLEDVATHVDFHSYPKPCLFYGNNLRGAIIGRHMKAQDAA